MRISDWSSDVCSSDLLVFDTVDLHYLRESRAAEIAGDAARARTAQRTRALELEVIARSNLTLVVSGAERALLADDAPAARVEVLSNLHHVPGPGPPFASGRAPCGERGCQSW